MGKILTLISQCQNVPPLQLSAPKIVAATLCIDPSALLCLILPSARIFAVIFLLLSNLFVPGLIIPSSTNDPNGILGFDLLFLSVSNTSS